MDDLVKRLRGYGSNRCWPHGPACDCTQAAARIEALEARVAAADALADAVTLYIYETTHLSAEEDDGSHWCKISKDCLAQGRTTIAAYRATKEGGA